MYQEQHRSATAPRPQRSLRASTQERHLDIDGAFGHTRVGERLLIELYAAYRSELMSWAQRNAGPGVEADDLVSMVFLTAWRRRDHLQTLTELEIRRWLYSAAGNVARNERRARRRALALAERLALRTPGVAHSPSTDAAGDRSAARLAAIVADLSTADREVLTLLAVEDKSPATVAAQLNASPGSIRQRMWRIRKQAQERAL